MKLHEEKFDLISDRANVNSIPNIIPFMDDYSTYLMNNCLNLSPTLGTNFEGSWSCSDIQWFLVISCQPKIIKSNNLISYCSITIR